MTHVQSRDRLFIRLSSFKLVFKTEKKKIITAALLLDYKAFVFVVSHFVRAESSEGHLAGHGHLGLVQPEWRRCAAETERSCLPACGLWHCRRNLSGESARNAAPNSSLKLLRVLLQVKLSSSCQ